jgi:hypothetical protein
MLHASHVALRLFMLLGGFLFAASIYTAVVYYPLQHLCTFCVTRAH